LAAPPSASSSSAISVRPSVRVRRWCAGRLLFHLRRYSSCSYVESVAWQKHEGLFQRCRLWVFSVHVGLLALPTFFAQVGLRLRHTHSRSTSSRHLRKMHYRMPRVRRLSLVLWRSLRLRFVASAATPENLHQDPPAAFSVVRGTPFLATASPSDDASSSSVRAQ
jgi:hypothetical protein